MWLHSAACQSSSNRCTRSPKLLVNFNLTAWQLVRSKPASYFSLIAGRTKLSVTGRKILHLVEDPIRVLLLDDDPENLLLRAAILRKHGYLTDTASTIGEAEKLLNKIDIAVLDYHLGAGQFGTDVAADPARPAAGSAYHYPFRHPGAALWRGGRHAPVEGLQLG